MEVDIGFWVFIEREREIRQFLTLNMRMEREKAGTFENFNPIQ